MSLVEGRDGPGAWEDGGKSAALPRRRGCARAPPLYPTSAPPPPRDRLGSASSRAGRQAALPWVLRRSRWASDSAVRQPRASGIPRGGTRLGSAQEFPPASTGPGACHFRRLALPALSS
jgi:hypothetical protein